MRGNLNPKWSGAELDLEGICNGDLNMAMKVIVWDYRRRGQHRMMGEFETTVKGFQAAMQSPDNQMGLGFSLVRPDTGKNVGTIQVLDATVHGFVNQQESKERAPSNPQSQQQQQKRPSSNGGANGTTNTPAKPPRRPEFVDYLSGGCQISLAVAIDFTASNGDPRQPGTPHYFHPPESREWNDYEKAIFAVGSILAKYDSDQRFPVWGFGAKYNNVVRHCFQCGSDVEVEGVQGIMDAYRGVFRTPLTMSYPTIFNEVIQTAASYARHEQVSDTEMCRRAFLVFALKCCLTFNVIITGGCRR